MKGKPIQISTCGVEATQSTQTNYVITMLTDAGEIFQKTSLNPCDDWEKVEFSGI